MRTVPVMMRVAGVVLGVALAGIAHAGEMRRLRAAHGSVLVRGAVVRGDRDRYTIRARAGQTLTARITSRERNAVFQIERPGGRFLAGAGEGDDATRWRGRLPVTGAYVFVVGGTRGNASYTLRVDLGRARRREGVVQAL